MLAGESGLQRDDTRAGEEDDQDQEAAEHMSLTVKMPAVTDTYYIELQDVSFAVTMHLLLFSVYRATYTGRMPSLVLSQHPSAACSMPLQRRSM